MTPRVVKVPGPDHAITIAALHVRVVVKVGDRIIASSDRALTLHEANYPAVHYIPRHDVDMSALQRTDHTTYCPYKGECAYYSVPGGGEQATNAVWTYESPYTAVSAIAGYLAFHPDRVNSIDVEASEPAMAVATT